MEEMKIAGKVLFYYKTRGMGLILLESDLKIGDEILVKGPNDSFKQKVTSMDIKIEDTIYLPIELGRAGNIVGIKLEKNATEDFLVYKI